MLKLYNAGGAGAEYSQLTIRRLAASESPLLVITFRRGDNTGDIDILLNRVQIEWLVDDLNVFLGSPALLIEGSL
jgi:hypothetical protein